MAEKNNSHPFDYLANNRYISLTTYRKNGTGVPTPVEFVRKGNKIFVNTRKKSYKVKRIQNNNIAEIAPCSMRGKIKGPSIKVNIRILPKEEEQMAINTLKSLYQGILYKFFINLTKLAFWREKAERVYLEIIPKKET